MPLIILETVILAPIDIVFDLSRSIDLHKESTKDTKEEAISGRTTGLIKLNESVTWKARHFGFTQILTSKITAYDSPSYFIDEMTKGIFKSFSHKHSFTEKDGQTTLIDSFNYESPLGLVGRIADYLFLKRYMTKFLIKRNLIIKEYAESEKWKKFLNAVYLLEQP